MEKCKIFLFGTGEGFEEVSDEVNKFLVGKEITRVLQSSATWAGARGEACIGTHLTIFYTEKAAT